MRLFLLALSALTVVLWAIVLMASRRTSTSKRRTRAEIFGVGVTPVFLAMMLSVGSIHQAPPFNLLPIDLIWLLLIGIALGVGYRLLPGRNDGTSTVVPGLALLVILGLGVAPGAEGMYGHDKTRNFAITVGLVWAASLLLNTTARRVRFLWGVVGVGVYTLVISEIAPATDIAVGRLAAEGATTSATARLAGSAVVILIAWMVNRRINVLLGLVGAGALGVLMFATGSRGPLLAVGVATIVVLLAGFGRRPVRSAAIIAGIVVATFIAWGQVSTVSQARISMALTSDPGASVTQREYMWDRSWQIAQHQLFGRGWGSLSGGELAVDRYPHQLFLEVLVEAGWIAAALLVFLFLFGGIRAGRARRIDPTAIPLLGSLVFWTVNALVSGDINDNRGVFLIVAACWLLPVVRKGRSEPLDDLDVPSAAGTTGTRGVAVARRPASATAGPVSSGTARSSGSGLVGPAPGTT